MLFGFIVEVLVFLFFFLQLGWRRKETKEIKYSCHLLSVDVQENENKSKMKTKMKTK